MYISEIGEIIWHYQVLPVVSTDFTPTVMFMVSLMIHVLVVTVHLAESHLHTLEVCNLNIHLGMFNMLKKTCNSVRLPITK